MIDRPNPIRMIATVTVLVYTSLAIAYGATITTPSQDAGEVECSVIRERTQGGLSAACARGRQRLQFERERRQTDRPAPRRPTACT